MIKKKIVGVITNQQLGKSEKPTTTQDVKDIFGYSKLATVDSDKMCQVLNNYLHADPSAISALFACCASVSNDRLEKATSCMVYTDDGPFPTVSVLGIINGFLFERGQPLIKRSIFVRSGTEITESFSVDVPAPPKKKWNHMFDVAFTCESTKENYEDISADELIAALEKRIRVLKSTNPSDIKEAVCHCDAFEDVDE